VGPGKILFLYVVIYAFSRTVFLYNVFGPGRQEGRGDLYLDFLVEASHAGGLQWRPGKGLAYRLRHQVEILTCADLGPNMLYIL
jgi:hypothetical protein